MSKVTDSFLRTIHQKSASLEEHFGISLAEGKVVNGLSLGQLLTWEKNVSGTGRPSLLNRIGWFKHEKELLLRLYTQYQIEHNTLTGWIAILNDILRAYNNEKKGYIWTHHYTQNQKPVPYQELLFPWLDYAAGALKMENSLFTRQAQSQYSHALLKELSLKSSACFQCEFDEFKTRTKSNSNDLYVEFVKGMYRGEIYSFWRKYASLARILVEVTERWILGGALLSQRLLNDYAIISSNFFCGAAIGPVIRMDTNLSSPHTREGQVLILHFLKGRRIVYKPRSGALDLVLEKILDWINGKEHFKLLKSAAIIDRQKYCWQEFIPYTTCLNEGEVHDYYLRTGYLSAILFMLGSTDYHFGNLRANGPYPILTDNETLFSARVKISAAFSISGDQCLDESISRSLAHGHFLMDTARLFYPNSPSIVGVFEDLNHYAITRCYPVNRDGMRLRRLKGSDKGSNVAKLNGKKSNPRSFVSSIKQGYCAMMCWLYDNRDDLKLLVRRQTENYGIKFRMLLRPSAWYHELLHNSFSPDLCRNGIDRSLYFEKIAAFYEDSHAKQELRCLFRAEKELAEEHLVPWFHIKANQRSYIVGHGQDMAQSIIKTSAKDRFESCLNHLERKPATELNERIFEHYLKSKLRGEKENCATETMIHNLYFCYNHFFSPANIPKSAAGIKNSVLKYYFFDEGITGVILLFSAWYRLKKEHKYKVLTLRLLEPLMHTVLHDPEFNLPVNFQIGALQGIGSIVNPLCTITKLIDEKVPAKLATKLMNMAGEVPVGDLSFATGLSGLLFAQLKYSMMREGDASNDSLLNGFDKLIHSALDNPEGNLSFMEGLPGILFVACKLAVHFENNYFLREIRGLSHTVRSNLSKNWKYKTLTFHHGLAGWIMVDKAVRELGLDSILPINLEAAFHNLNMVSSKDVDYFAFGNAGKLEALLLLKEDLTMDPANLYNKWITNFNLQGKFILSPKYLNPFFYRGISGILYQQLRYVHTDEIPSVWAIN